MYNGTCFSFMSSGVVCVRIEVVEVVLARIRDLHLLRGRNVDVSPVLIRVVASVRRVSSSPTSGDSIAECGDEATACYTRSRK